MDTCEALTAIAAVRAGATRFRRGVVLLALGLPWVTAGTVRKLVGTAAIESAGFVRRNRNARLNELKLFRVRLLVQKPKCLVADRHPLATVVHVVIVI